MINPQILVVDDEKPLREFISRNLEARGFKVFKAANGLEALAIAGVEALDLVILDVMLPRMDGLETCRRLRQTSAVPIIILTALGEEKDKVTALNLGADDYLTKPFGVEELLARVRAMLRRVSWDQQEGGVEQLLSYGDLTLDEKSMSVMVRGARVSLTKTEFDLLTYFFHNIGKSISHRTILQKVWGEAYGNEAEYLRVYIGRLRRKIEPNPGKPIYLHTEYGLGYRFGES